MARPREFDQDAVLDAAVRCFWQRGYEATSMRDLMDETGLAGASLYNAFGDKREVYRKALDHYVGKRIAQRIRRCEMLPPREAIGAFFAEVIERSLADRRRKGCMLVNAALEVAPHDRRVQEAVARSLGRIEAFFFEQLLAGQAGGTIARSIPAQELARHLLGILMGVRVLARVRPERTLLEGAVAPALAVLEASRPKAG